MGIHYNTRNSSHTQQQYGLHPKYLQNSKQSIATPFGYYTAKALRAANVTCKPDFMGMVTVTT